MGHVMADDPLRVYRKLGQMNHLANLRLQAACAGLPEGGYAADRPSFFGSIRATMNHILLVDRFYIGALEGRGLDRPALETARACPGLAQLADWQAAADQRLLHHLAGLTPADLSRIVAVDRGDRVQHDRRDDLLSHLFQHQTHHRGQVHAMLSAAGVAPPQLDEFIVGDDAAARADDLRRLGWSEDDLMR